jgi:serine phosphatase RsbU (regulator of sigma subunit)
MNRENKIVVQPQESRVSEIKRKDLLYQLPAGCRDPVFVCDRNGRIVSAEGLTKKAFHENRINKISDIFEITAVEAIFQLADGCVEDLFLDPIELYSEGFGKWYQVQAETREEDYHVLVWLNDITSRKSMQISLSAINRFSREVIDSINELVNNNDIYDRLALLILGEGYQGVFITREDRDGNLSGYAFKKTCNELEKSELIVVAKNSSAPIWASRRAECDVHGCVASETKSSSVTQDDFERIQAFDERVKEFFGFPITSYINYAEGEVSIIAFNKNSGIKKIDSSVINAAVNTARSVTRLIDLATGNKRMLSALALAEEVQQNLLPQNIPIVKGLDIAGRVIYCNKAGGDYYDFIQDKEGADAKLNIVIGDASGHGIAAGLLMATARALIRSRSAQPGSLAEIVTDVNRNLTVDIQKTNRFMTLFYLAVDSPKKCLRWVRAGHDAALVYRPSANEFIELLGNGMALGLDENYLYEENEMCDIENGTIIFLGTDGIWEARDAEGSLFGKQAVLDIIRNNSGSGAGEILAKILTALNDFRGNREAEDDVTLIVLKNDNDS